MRSRLFSLFSCLILSASSVATIQAADLATQRQYYDEAKRALAKGDSGPYMRYAAELQDYPWRPTWPTTSSRRACAARATPKSRASWPSMATCPRPTG